MTAASLFQSLMGEHVQPVLKAVGHRRRGLTFRREIPGTVQIVQFQKSRRTSKAQVIFTVNLGIASSALLRRRGIESSSCAIEECHWRDRLRPPNCSDEHWWTLEDGQASSRVGTEVVDWLGKYGLPLLESYGSETALRDLWLSGQSPGLTEPQRLVNLSILLSEQGPRDSARQVVEEIRELARRRPLPMLVERLEELDEPQ